MTLRNRFGSNAHPIAPNNGRTVAGSLGGLADGRVAIKLTPPPASQPPAEELPSLVRDGHVVLDHFDGVHRGHQAAIRHATQQSRLRRGPVIALSCDGVDSAARLTTLEETGRLLVRSGADAVITLGADCLASPDWFVANFLKAKLGARSLVIGPHGVTIAGDAWRPGALAELAARHGVTVHILPQIANPRPVSTTEIRRCLSEGDVTLASEMLGRFWSVGGVVVHGAKRGRELGMRTANVSFRRGVDLAHGVYAIRALAKRRICDGVASFGRRPQFDNGEPLLEVHLFGFDDDLYGDLLRVEFVGWLRGETTFTTIEDLVAQMNADVADARSVLNAASRTTRSALNWTESLDEKRVTL